jgi:hypothetical protein
MMSAFHPSIGEICGIAAAPACCGLSVALVIEVANHECIDGK